MPPTVIAILASVAIAGGFGALVGILVGGRRTQRTTDTSPTGGQTVTSRPVSPGVTLGTTMRDIAPKGYIGMLDRQVVLAGRPPAWTVDRILMAKPVLAIVALLVSWWWISGDPVLPRFALGAFVVTLSFFVPDLLIYSRALERQEKIQNALADTLDQMTIAVEAGLGFESAMAKAATNGKGPLAEEFIRTLQDMSIGRARKDAYESFSERTSSPDLRRFTRSIIQADAYGLAIADVLRIQAAEMRLRRRQRAEEKAMKVPVKVLFPLVFCILPVLFIVLLTPAVLGIIKAFS
ncbi:type II secretion system F family protein [Cryobacterium tagatosivorans]|uniref:Type II secretion system F family protein n=1 Tax=Cryobacterium tagatosivorans TaxID=1259199 RepID=A0A4R8UCE0_9MICO|nr:type II secretion system F family protein [Cryobacterium tagatosivorans]TFB48957.1 type II secretion system F family protein [Cryobacterium tagatosivorans]